MHVARIRKKVGTKEYCSTLLRHSYRDENGKVKNITLANLSMLPEPIIIAIEQMLKGKRWGPLDDQFKILHAKPHGHVAAVLGMLRKLKLDTMIDQKPSRMRSLILGLIVMRILNPKSKLATARQLDEETCTTSLNTLLGLGRVTEDDLYAAMDWLVKRKPSIEQRLAKKHLRKGSLILYDLTSTYYEGNRCRYAEFGYSRDRKRGTPQIVFGLLCTRDGVPVSVSVYDGNTSDSTTLADQLEKVREEYELSEIVWVGDRGTITQKNITEELKERDGLRWITALRSDSIRMLLEQGSIDRSLFDVADIAEISVPEYPGERLVVCYNPLLASDRHRKRQTLLEKTEESLEKIRESTRRVQRRLCGSDRIGVRVGAVLNKHHMQKHFQITISDDSFEYCRDEASITAEEALDGFYVIRSNVSVRRMEASELVGAYKRLSRVEHAFRVTKQSGLRVRPVYHYRDDRVESHLFLCMLALYVHVHLEQAWTPYLYMEDSPESASQKRTSMVAPAVLSDQTLRKKQSKRTADGFPVHSFAGLLDNLSLVTWNHIRWEADSVDIPMVSCCSPLHDRVLGALGVEVYLSPEILG